MSERYEIKTLKEAFGIVKSPDLEVVIAEFEGDFKKIARFTGIYLSRNEVIDGIRERVFDGLNDKYLDLKSRISYARKHGADLNPLDFGVLRVPLKIKMLNAVFNLDNYRLIVVMLNDDEKQLVEFEKQVEELEEQREIREAKREGRKPLLKNFVKEKVTSSGEGKEQVKELTRVGKSKVRKQQVRKATSAEDDKAKVRVVEKAVVKKKSLGKKLSGLREKIAAVKGLKKK